MARIQDPPGSYRDANGRLRDENGKFIKDPQLQWNKEQLAKRRGSFPAKQKYIDSEVLRLCDPLIPLKTGVLKNSGKLGTVIGSGVVQYTAPYARKQYYSTAESRSYDPQRGAKWFERMKAAHLKEILEGAQKYDK